MTRRRACCCGGDGGAPDCTTFLAQCAPQYGSQLRILYQMSYTAVFLPTFCNGCGQNCYDQAVFESGSCVLDIVGVWQPGGTLCGFFTLFPPHYCFAGSFSGSSVQTYNCIDPNWLPTGDPCADGCPPHLAGTNVRWIQSNGVTGSLSCAQPQFGGAGARWGAVLINADGTGSQTNSVTAAGACCGGIDCPPPFSDTTGPFWPNSTLWTNEANGCTLQPPPCGTDLSLPNSLSAWAWRTPACSESTVEEFGGYRATISRTVSLVIQ